MSNGNTKAGLALKGVSWLGRALTVAAAERAASRPERPPRAPRAPRKGKPGCGPCADDKRGPRG